MMNNMKTKELKITIPEGQEIDWQESAKQEKIVFKKKENTKPRSWEEYCEQQSVNSETGYYINDTDCSFDKISWHGCSMVNQWKNVLPSKELAEAFLAIMQLISLRQAWIGDWKPDWSKETAHKNPKYCIVSTVSEGFSVEKCYNSWIPMLSFQTKEMAEDFMNCFKGLLNIAKPLI